VEYTADMGIGVRVRALRERKGWSQAALARAAGISQPTIAKLEADPTRDTKRLAEIARALDVEPAELDPKYSRRAPIQSAAEASLSTRSADDWDRLIFRN
jgi:transcriptional regulator with XRE-family HTH domain